ncbi:hypothetical protein, partial [Achromobacter xylosoxidans]|uniref:hypothetical protein n=1 Tax=Alcaligenes xylosoxydans xylosoxydans TaxID=85698 RepID=UPI002367E2BF
MCDSFDFFLLETAYFKEFGGFADKTERGGGGGGGGGGGVWGGGGAGGGVFFFFCFFFVLWPAA